MLIINTAWNHMELNYIQDVAYADGHSYMQNCIHIFNTVIVCAVKHGSITTVSALIQ